MYYSRRNAFITLGTTATFSVVLGTSSFVSARPDTPTIASFTSSIQISQTDGNLLSPEQKEELTQLPIPIVAPSYLPIGFQLTHATGGTEEFINGDINYYYYIQYENDNGGCIRIGTSQFGTDGLEPIRHVETELGAVEVFVDNLYAPRNIYGFLEVEGYPVLRSGEGTSFSSANETCHRVSMETYDQVLESLTIVE